MNAKRWIFWPSFLLLAAGCAGASYYVRYSAEKSKSAQFAAMHDEALRFQQQIVRYTAATVPARLPFAIFLQTMGIDSPTAVRVINAAQPIFNLRHLRAGNQLAVGRGL